MDPIPAASGRDGGGGILRHGMGIDHAERPGNVGRGPASPWTADVGRVCRVGASKPGQARAGSAKGHGDRKILPVAGRKLFDCRRQR